MKKSLIALAVAGSFAAPAFAATSNVDVYGIINMALEDTNKTDIAVISNTSRIGFKGTEDLGGGLKAVWQIESALSGNGDGMGGSNKGLGTRNTFVGLAGGFGTVLMGRHDTPYKLGTASLDIFADTIGDYNLGRLGIDLLDNAQDARDAQALAYISPTWSGFHFAVATVLSNGEANGSAFATDKTVDATSATGVYMNGPIFASLSYQKVEAADSKAWKLGAGYNFGDANVGLIYEKVDYSDWTRKTWLLNGVYNMGPVALKAEYGKVDYDGDTGKMWALGADYNLSKRTAAYLVYSHSNINDYCSDCANSGWNLGVKHSF